jgi:hypothetical protein
VGQLVLVEFAVGCVEPPFFVHFPFEVFQISVQVIRHAVMLQTQQEEEVRKVQGVTCASNIKGKKSHLYYLFCGP